MSGTARVTANPQTAAASAVDLSKVYGEGDTRVIALDNVGVEFPRGQFTAIMGPSGSGKSTLMHCMAGLDSITAGSARIGDTELARLNDKQLTAAAPGPDRLRLPVVQPAGDAHRAGEHHAPDGHRRRASPTGRGWTGW